MECVAPDATESPGRVAGFLDVRVPLDDDGVLQEDFLVADLQRTMRRQTVAVALAAQVADGTAPLQWYAETVSKTTTSH